MNNKQGVCPVCMQDIRSYGGMSLSGDMAYYTWECENCHTEGEEWYKVEFNGHNILVDEEWQEVNVDSIDFENIRKEKNIKLEGDNNE